MEDYAIGKFAYYGFIRVCLLGPWSPEGTSRKPQTALHSGSVTRYHNARWGNFGADFPAHMRGINIPVTKCEEVDLLVQSQLHSTKIAQPYMRNARLCHKGLFPFLSLFTHLIYGSPSNSYHSSSTGHLPSLYSIWSSSIIITLITSIVIIVRVHQERLSLCFAVSAVRA